MEKIVIASRRRKERERSQIIHLKWRTGFYWSYQGYIYVFRDNYAHKPLQNLNSGLGSRTVLLLFYILTSIASVNYILFCLEKHKFLEARQDKTVMGVWSITSV